LTPPNQKSIFSKNWWYPGACFPDTFWSESSSLLYSLSTLRGFACQVLRWVWILCCFIVCVPSRGMKFADSANLGHFPVIPLSNRRPIWGTIKNQIAWGLDAYVEVLITQKFLLRNGMSPSVDPKG
jgi:hypothetical protein